MREREPIERNDREKRESQIVCGEMGNKWGRIDGFFGFIYSVAAKDTTSHH